MLDISGVGGLFQHWASNLDDVAVGGASMLILSAAVRAMPAPMVGGNPFYQWFYQFMQIILANFDKAKQTQPAAEPVVPKP